MPVTIHVHDATHEQIVELSRAMGTPLIDTVLAAAEALRRQLFAGRVTAEVDVRRQG